MQALPYPNIQADNWVACKVTNGWLGDIAWIHWNRDNSCLGGMEQEDMRCYHATQTTYNLKLMNFSPSGIIHLIFSDHGWPGL